MSECRTSRPAGSLGRGWLIACLATVVAGLFLFAFSGVLGALMMGIGIYCAVQFRRLRTARADPGNLEFQADPTPGALKGDVGGWISFTSLELADTEPVVELACIRLSERQRSQIVEHRRETVWSECRPVSLDHQGQRLGFCFSPPSHLPETEPQPEITEHEWRHSHYWVLTLKGQLGGLDYSRSFRFPVRRGTGAMREELPEDFRVRNRPLDAEGGDALESLREQVGLSQHDDVLRFSCRPASGQWLEPLLAGIGMLLLLAGLAGTVTGFWRFAWLVVGLALTLSMGLRWGKGLDTEVKGADFAVTTYWFGKPLFVRRVTFSDDAALEVRPRLLSMLRINGRGEPGYDLVLQTRNREVLVARDIAGKHEVEALVARLNVHAGKSNED